MAKPLYERLSKAFSLLAVQEPQFDRKAVLEEIATIFSEIGENDWAAPTGVADRTTFDASTVTLQELGERVAGLVEDFTQ